MFIVRLSNVIHTAVDVDAVVVVVSGSGGGVVVLFKMKTMITILNQRFMRYEKS